MQLIGAAVAVTPDQAAESLASFEEKFDISKTGQYWAPRGPGYVYHFLHEREDWLTCRDLDSDIGTAEAVLGKDLPTPLQLPW